MVTTMVRRPTAAARTANAAATVVLPTPPGPTTSATRRVAGICSVASAVMPAPPHPVRVRAMATPQGSRSYRVRVGEREHTVEVREGGTTVVDGEALHVLVGSDGRAAVTGGDGTRTVVHVAGGVDPRQAGSAGLVHAVQVLTQQQAALAALGGAHRADAAGKTLRSPMPGRIVRVLVREGDRVAADTPMVIVEAMKMENEVRSAGAATVVRVAVNAGEAVEAGAVLCELEPHVATSG
ncbi:MAG: hypothetical protein K1X88_26545 [Nannocystaceae bacterium]|nr:hypothetical protein [Nannocystaceae bacterium]